MPWEFLRQAIVYADVRIKLNAEKKHEPPEYTIFMNASATLLYFFVYSSTASRLERGLTRGGRACRRAPRQTAHVATALRARQFGTRRQVGGPG
jgi:hypothetical protein